jgi:hypothetical protein
MANTLVTNRTVAKAPGNEESETSPSKPASLPKGKGKQVSDGPTCGYRDVKGGGIERRNFVDGFLPNGWHDSPASCKNEWDRKPIPLV